MTDHKTDQKRPTSIDDAIKMLDDVLVKQQLPDLSPILGEEFTSVKESVKNLISETTRSELRDLKEATAEFRNTASEIGAAAAAMTGVGIEQAQAMAQEGVEQVKKIATDLDSKVRANPWPLIGGVALGALALGVLLARSANSNGKSTLDDSEGPTPPPRSPKGDI